MQNRMMRLGWRENPEDGVQWGNWLDAPPVEPVQASQPLDSDAPTSAWTKGEIVDWLHAEGVTLTDEALMQLTKAELLEIVENMTNGDVDPADVTV